MTHWDDEPASGGCVVFFALYIVVLVYSIAFAFLL